MQISRQFVFLILSATVLRKQIQLLTRAWSDF
jgi:hypothetical protein